MHELIKEGRKERRGRKAGGKKQETAKKRNSVNRKARKEDPTTRTLRQPVAATNKKTRPRKNK